MDPLKTSLLVVSDLHFDRQLFVMFGGILGVLNDDTGKDVPWKEKAFYLEITDAPKAKLASLNYNHLLRFLMSYTLFAFFELQTCVRIMCPKSVPEKMFWRFGKLSAIQARSATRDLQLWIAPRSLNEEGSRFSMIHVRIFEKIYKVTLFCHE